MKLAKAILIKRITDDGLMEVNEDVPIGREYTVDLESRGIEKLYNATKGKIHEKEIIYIVDGNRKAFFPTELLRIKE